MLNLFLFRNFQSEKILFINEAGISLFIVYFGNF